jgi:prepilin-type N-terminal cleavage/methylation domain-containing protein
MKVNENRSNRLRRAGFTLLELIVVIGILVILAGLVVGKLDLLQVRANKGVAASNMSGVGRLIRLYRVSHQSFPDNWDSLITTNGGTRGTTLWKATTTDPSLLTSKGLDPQAVGGPPAGVHQKLTATTLTDGQLYSLYRVGVRTVLDVDTAIMGASATTVAPGNAFGSKGSTAAGFTPFPLASGATVAMVNDGDSDGRAIISEFYAPWAPNGLYSEVDAAGSPFAGRRLMVFGFGPLNQACLSSSDGALLECPTYSNAQNPALYYDRYLAVFDVSPSGKRARLVSILGSDGDRISEEVADFKDE